MSIDFKSMQQNADTTLDVIALANAVVSDSTGNRLKVGMLWAKQSVILVFLRHYACIACRAHAEQVWGERDRYERTGAKLIFIGNGSPDYIERFRSDLKLNPAVVLTDPSLETFRAAGFKRGFFRVVNPQSAVNAAKLAMRGHKQAAYSQEAGTHWQLGGVVAVNTKGKVLYHYISHVLGDFPPDEDVEVMARDEEN